MSLKNYNEFEMIVKLTLFESFLYNWLETFNEQDVFVKWQRSISFIIGWKPLMNKMYREMAKKHITHSIAVLNN